MKWIIVACVLMLAAIPFAYADTLIVYPSVDQDVYNGTEATVSVIRNAPGETYHPANADTLYAGIATWSAASPKVDHLFRPIAIYNTSPIGSGGSISSVTQTIFSEDITTGLGNPDFSITGGSPASYLSIATSDYNKFANTEFITGVAYGSISTWEWQNFTFNADGRGYINKTGHTALYYRNSWDTLNDYTGYTWSSGAETVLYIESVDHPESSRRPFLTIVYTPGAPPDTTPPDSITGLANGTFDCIDHHVDLSWTNPTDADYYRLNAYLNGTLIYYGNTTDSVTLEGLPESATMMFNTTTEDLLGNLNATWVNISFVTDLCAAPPETGEVCYFVNTTAESIKANSTSWNITIGNISWGTLIVNATQGNLSHWSCFGTPTPTPTPIPTTINPTWTPEINPPSPDSFVGTIRDWIKNFLKDVFK